MKPSELFDTSILSVGGLAKRHHNLDTSAIMPLLPCDGIHPDIRMVGRDMQSAVKAGAGVVMMIGAHVIRAGVQRYLIDLMERGAISCLAMNGAGVIHDYEFALIGATTESVAHYIQDGSFGLWRETGHINDIVADGAVKGFGLGEAVGRHIEQNDLPYRQISLLAAAFRMGIPATVHVGIGYDIVFEMPNCNGAAYGATSYRDFLRFAQVLQRLENGVVMNFGSAVMAPEIYLKALSMARNAARQENRQIRRFTTLVCDLVPLPASYRTEPEPDDPRYYFRPWKTMLVRTIDDGGQSHYVRGNHKETIPQLWSSYCNASPYGNS